MSSPAPFILIVAWLSTVKASDETLVHGWIPEPQGRGTWSILWSCLATIFICTWSALHLDVQERHGKWYLFVRKLGAMLLAAMAPEYFLFRSALNFFEARDLRKKLVKRGNQEWTLTHMQFACAGGFRTRTPEGDTSICTSEQLWTLIDNKEIDGPPLSEGELQARGKSDLVVKTVAILQIVWFVVQTLVRAIQHYQTTALEIMTVAFVFCSVFIYGFALYQPQDAEYPVILEVSNVAPVTDKSNPAGRDARPRSEPGFPSLPSPNKYVPGLTADLVPALLFGLFACGFGAIHCLAWNSPFPTSKERLAWRICAATTTSLPPLVVLASLIGISDNSFMEVIGYLGLSLIAVSYVVGRLAIIVLAFMALRALPADAFQTLSWNDYIPHFAA